MTWLRLVLNCLVDARSYRHQHPVRAMLKQPRHDARRPGGVIALFDQRFLHAPYLHHLPPDWLPEEGAGVLVGDPAEVAEEFFRVLSLKG
jgi:hypothetical protein